MIPKMKLLNRQNEPGSSLHYSNEASVTTELLSLVVLLLLPLEILYSERNVVL